MIRMVKNHKALSEGDVLGKYVLRDQGFHWEALGKPLIVTGISGSRAYVDEEGRKWDEQAKQWYLTGTGERSPAGHISLSTVRCICDTAEEANAVIEASRVADVEFRELLGNAKARLAELDGVSVTPEGRTAKP